MIEINSKKFYDTMLNIQEYRIKEIKQIYLTYVNVLIIYMRKIKTYSTILAVFI